MINPIPEKNTWPPTIDGTTDWEVLFENDEQGLFAIVAATQTPAQLKQITEDIIRALFSRKQDQPVLGKVTAFLEKLIPEDASEDRFPVMQVTVKELLGKIKENRIERAAAYVAKKAKKAKQKKSNKKNNRRPNLIVGFFRRCADALVFLFGLVSGGTDTKDKKDKESATAQDGEEAFFKQDAYVHNGGGDTEWQDSDMYAMKEAETAKPGVFEDLEEKKPNDKYESWDDYE